MNFKVVKPEITKDELLKLIAEQFPEIEEELFDEDYAGLIHLQIGLLANNANENIEKARLTGGLERQSDVAGAQSKPGLQGARRRSNNSRICRDSRCII